MNIIEKYRPRTLADLVGQGGVVHQLSDFVADPYPNAFIFAGGTGVGKTSAALAFAADLGCDVEQQELGGLYTIPSGEQTADTLRETLRSLGLRPMFGNGWKCLIVNEADRMSPAVQYLWLDALESIPPKTAIVFTTNHESKLERRFVTRCELFRFHDSADVIGPDLQLRINSIWQAETGRSDAPRLTDLAGAIEGDSVSIRAALQALNPLVRDAKRTRPPEQAVSVHPTIQPSIEAPGLRKWSDVDFAALVTRYKAGVKFMALVRETGIPQSTLAREMERNGAIFPTRKKATA